MGFLGGLPVLLGLAFSLNAFAEEKCGTDYPAAARDRQAIVDAVAKSGRVIRNLCFPLAKQIGTTLISASNKPRELVDALKGSKEGFSDHHVIQFQSDDKMFTCVATVRRRTDGMNEVAIANCGVTSWKFFTQDRFIEKTSVLQKKNSDQDATGAADSGKQ